MTKPRDIPDHHDELSDVDLEQVNGGFLPVLAAAAAAEVFVPGITAAAAAGGMWLINGGVVTVGNTIANGIGYAEKAYDAVNSYLNPTPGNGAPGDTYVPATANADGSINPGHFEAPTTPTDTAPAGSLADQAGFNDIGHSPDDHSADTHGAETTDHPADDHPADNVDHSGDNVDHSGDNVDHSGDNVDHNSGNDFGDHNNDGGGGTQYADAGGGGGDFGGGGGDFA